MTNVIIVEDDPMVAQLNAQYLRQIPQIQVEGIFYNGRDALDYLKSHSVELAIVDIYMPRFSGLELLQSIRCSGISTNIIMITAATEMQAVEQALRLGIEDYIVKPFQFRRLQEAIQNYFNKTALVKSMDTASQEVIDQLLSRDYPDRAAAPGLRKGLNAKTLQLIQEILHADCSGARTCESIAAAAGLSKVTVRNYLNYLIEIGRLESAVDYETGGRPRILYRMK